MNEEYSMARMVPELQILSSRMLAFQTVKFITVIWRDTIYSDYKKRMNRANIRIWPKFNIWKVCRNLHYQGKSTPFIKFCHSKLSGSTKWTEIPEIWAEVKVRITCHESNSSGSDDI